MSTAICVLCSGRLIDFHQFYEMVENAHKSYRTTESVIIKTEEAPVDFSSLPSKHEPTDVFDDEFSEMPFPLATTTKDGFSKMLEVSHDTLSQSNISHDDQKPNKELDVDSDREEEWQHNQDDSEESDPIYEPEVSKTETLSKKNSSSVAEIVSESRKRITRNSKKLQATSNDVEIDVDADEAIPKIRKKRVTKARTVDKTLERKPKKPKAKDKGDKNCEEQTAYKDKMKSFDAQISQYMGLHCDVCNVAADNFASLKLHMRNEHNMENGYVKCCDKKFHRRANLLYHIRHHVDPDCYRYVYILEQYAVLIEVGINVIFVFIT